MSLFTDVCWRHWPKGCTCPPSANEIERMKSDVFLLDRELQRENRRAREFAIALAADPDYAWSWHCAVWAAAHDEGLETGAANRAAARLMRAAFDVDTTKNPNFSSAHLMTKKEQQ